MSVIVSSEVVSPGSITTAVPPSLVAEPVIDTSRATGVVRVEAWSDPTIEAVGHDPRSRYALVFWVPAIGPGSWVAAVNMRDRLDVEPRGFELDLAVLGQAIGMPSRSATARVIARLDGFGLARWQPRDRLLRVRLAWPSLKPGLVSRLPAHLQAIHPKG